MIQNSNFQLGNKCVNDVAVSAKFYFESIKKYIHIKINL